MIRGSIHWADLDKRRPVIIVSVTRRNELAHDVMVVPCSTRLRPMVWHVHLKRGEGGLPSDSIAKCEQIMTLPKDELSSEPLGAPLASARMVEIERAMMIALGILVPE